MTDEKKVGRVRWVAAQGEEAVDGGGLTSSRRAVCRETCGWGLAEGRGLEVGLAGCNATRLGAGEFATKRRSAEKVEQRLGVLVRMTRCATRQRLLTRQRVSSRITTDGRAVCETVRAERTFCGVQARRRTQIGQSRLFSDVDTRGSRSQAERCRRHSRAERKMAIRRTVDGLAGDLVEPDEGGQTGGVSRPLKQQPALGRSLGAAIGCVRSERATGGGKTQRSAAVTLSLHGLSINAVKRRVPERGMAG